MKKIVVFLLAPMGVLLLSAFGVPAHAQIGSWYQQSQKELSFGLQLSTTSRSIPEPGDDPVEQSTTTTNFNFSHGVYISPEWKFGVSYGIMGTETEVDVGYRETLGGREIRNDFTDPSLNNSSVVTRWGLGVALYLEPSDDHTSFFEVNYTSVKPDAEGAKSYATIDYSAGERFFIGDERNVVVDLSITLESSLDDEASDDTLTWGVELGYLYQ